MAVLISVEDGILISFSFVHGEMQGLIVLSTVSAQLEGMEANSLS